MVHPKYKTTSVIAIEPWDEACRNGMLKFAHLVDFHSEALAGCKSDSNPLDQNDTRPVGWGGGIKGPSDWPN